jgi:mRNA-degrading endonuclease RelE of RelBE toxin-antitoxin system
MTSDRYRIELWREAEKDLKRHRTHAKAILENLQRLESDPLKGHSLTGSLRGARSLEFNVKGSGAFRAIYVVLPDLTICVVFMLGPHENIYARAESRWLAVRRTYSLE